MVISYNGLEHFKIQYGDTVLAFNPVSKKSKAKQSKFGSDIALSSLNHPDFNGFENVTHGEKEPFQIHGPGAYEIKDIFIEGHPSVSKYDGKEGINTIYKVNLEDMNICYLGAIGSPEIPSKTLEELGDIDILFVPIGNDGVLSAEEAYKLAVFLEAKIVIPMHYDEKSLRLFLKEGSSEDVKLEPKLTLKKKDLTGKEAEIVVIKES